MKHLLFDQRCDRRFSNRVATKQILLFSSDATQLYKADIFRCLAAPDCFTIQFRYAKKWVHPDIGRDPGKIRGQSGIVFFVAGNDQTVPIEGLKLKGYSIRFCKIQDAFFDHDTEKIIVVLALGRFIECKIETVRQSII